MEETTVGFKKIAVPSPNNTAKKTQAV